MLCGYTNKPAWAQNDAMMAAYMSGMDYYYRVNDDTVMISPGWVKRFTHYYESKMGAVGIMGPTHAGDKAEILTYDFANRKHIEIFGFYYPRLFRDWFADNWITDVYKMWNTVKSEKVLS